MISLRRWRIWISEGAAEAITSAAREHHPVEIGGVLLGVGVEQRPWVTEAIIVPSTHQTPTYYELPYGARHAAVDTARRDDGRLGYIGDWHAHPANVGPSTEDVSTMRRVASDDDAECSHPVMLIARRVGPGYVLDAWQFTGRRLRELKTIAAGQLPQADSDVKHRPRPTDMGRQSVFTRASGINGTCMRSCLHVA